MVPEVPLVVEVMVLMVMCDGDGDDAGDGSDGGGDALFMTRREPGASGPPAESLRRVC